MPPDLTELAVGSLRSVRTFGQRIPQAGGLLAGSLSSPVEGRTVMITGASSSGLQAVPEGGESENRGDRPDRRAHAEQRAFAQATRGVHW